MEAPVRRMTDQEYNLKMCEWMGWAKKHCERCACETWHSPAGDCAGKGDFENLPNYLSDDSPRWLLNEAEARLTNPQRFSYEAELTLLCVDDGYPLPNNCMATARQRVIAILQVVKPELFQ